MKFLSILSMVTGALLLQSLVLRHDVPDEKFIELAKKYPQICHFAMGEGTLIDSQWILTAGHIGHDLLLDMENGKKPTVFCQGQSYSIEKVLLHPDFKNLEEGLNHDICLIKIMESIHHIPPAKIYSHQDETGKHIILVGSGDVGTGKTGPQRWDKITRAATNIIDGVERNWIYFVFDAPESRNTTEYEGVSGPGDSGGPAFTEAGDSLYIIGVSSFQKGQEKYGKGRYGVTEYYTRVSAYHEWIAQSLHDNGKPIAEVHPTEQNDRLKGYAGNYGFRKIILKNSRLYFQRDEEPWILMKEIGMDLFLWDDGNTKLQFVRDGETKIMRFEIHRKNGEVVKAERTP